MPQPKADAKVKTTPPPIGKPKKAQPAPPPPEAGPLVPMPLFRRYDWLALIITTIVTLAGYLWTLAPDVTLEDSGELAVASYYAGVPHPPGYPVWTIYTWLFTVLLPFSNIAWRVGVSSAVAAALSSGFLALMVSRVSSLLIDSVDTRKQIEERMHQAICVVSAVAAGLLIGFNGFMWSQAVIVEVYTLSVLSLVLTLVFLLHYVYAPNQPRYLYWAAFLFGIAFTNHQTLIVAAMGIEVLIALANPRLGRDALQANSLIYLLGLAAMQAGALESIRTSNALFLIFNLVGLASIAGFVWLALRTGKRADEMARDLLVYAGLGFILSLPFAWAGLLPLKGGVMFLYHVFGLAAVAGAIWFVKATWHLERNWLTALISLFMWVFGASFYFYMPIAGATNPPLNWGYPRTWDGFVHAFTRGQYEKTNPTLELGRIFDQVLMLFEGAVEEFNLVYLLIALVPFLLWARLRRTEKSWMLGLVAIYSCLAFLLLWLLNPNPDRQSRELTKVFFTASHVIIAMGFGYGLTLIAAVLAAEYQLARRWVMISAAVAGGIALFVVAVTFGAVELFPPDRPSYFFGIEATRDPVNRIASLLALAFAVAGVCLLALRPARLELKWLLVLFALLPVKSMLTHWADNEQRGHLFGYWFGHDMFTPPFNDKDGKPLYPEMTKNAILFGGTDPGRFNPTYMIFCESFVPPRCKPRDPAFDRRDVYLITQNALADGTYLSYIRAHYNRSDQFQYDTPFFQEMLRSQREKEKNLYTNFIARAVAPLDRLLFRLGHAVEKKRRAGSSWFKPEDFTNLTVLAARLRPGGNQDPFSLHLSGLLSERTRELIESGNADRRLARALASDLNQLLDSEYEERMNLQEQINALGGSRAVSSNQVAQIAALKKAYEERPNYLYRPDIINRLTLSPEVQRLIRQDLPTSSRIRMGRRILEEAYPDAIAQSPGGVYPELEIHTPTPEESSYCYNEYMQDAFQRKQIGQLRQGEDVREDNGRVTVSGQVAVMSINALLCRVIFDANPDHEFFIEESFPLEWMYPYLTPFGIIMKINRQPIAALDEDTLRRDHEFWRQYSERLIGDWITYDTSVKEICDFVEKVYIQRDLSGFKGDPKFIRDDNAQKAFSKLRSSIGGVYSWRVANAKSLAERERMIKEADFALRQAFAFCPYSPEAVFRYAQLLTTVGRLEDAYLVANTALRMDPFNLSVVDLVTKLRELRGTAPQFEAALNMFQRQEEEYRTNPGNISNAIALAQTYLDNHLFNQATQVFDQVVRQLEPQWQASPTNLQIGSYLAASYIQLREPQKARAVLNRLIESPSIDPNTLIAAAQTYASLSDGENLEKTLARLVQLTPTSAEAWYDYAGVLSSLRKPHEALHALSNALSLSDARRARDPNARDLRGVAATDGRFNNLRNLPGWRNLVR